MEALAIDTVQQMIDAWNRRDTVGMVELYSRDCVVRTDDAWPDGGEFRGRASVRRFYETVLADHDAQARIEGSPIVTGDRVLIQTHLHTRGRITGAEADFVYTQVITLGAEGIERIEHYFDHDEALVVAGLA